MLYGVIVYLGFSSRHYTLCYIVTRGFSAKKYKAFDSMIKGYMGPSHFSLKNQATKLCQVLIGIEFTCKV